MSDNFKGFNPNDDDIIKILNEKDMATPPVFDLFPGLMIDWNSNETLRETGVLGKRICCYTESSIDKVVWLIDDFKKLHNKILENYKDAVRSESVIVRKTPLGNDGRSATVVGLLNGVKLDKYKKYFSFFNTLERLSKKCQELNCPGRTPILSLYSDIAVDFYFTFSVNIHDGHLTMLDAIKDKNYCRREYQYGLSGGLVYSKYSNEWGVHT